jgi:hypothetical protein
VVLAKSKLTVDFASRFEYNESSRAEIKRMKTTYTVRMFDSDLEDLNADEHFDTLKAAQEHIIHNLEEDEQFYANSGFSYRLFQVEHQPRETELKFEVKTAKQVILI